jgi:hypothetical protein
MRHYLSMAVVLLSFMASDAYAQLREFQSLTPARSTGINGLGRSFAAGGNALFLNPAAIAIAPQYVLGTTYSVAKSPDSAGKDRFSHLLGAEWTDSTPNVLNMAMGMGYNLEISPGKKRNSVHAALAYVFRKPTFTLGIGLGGHWAEDFMPGGGKKANLLSADAGLSFSFRNQLMIGFTGYNLVNNHFDDTPKGFGGGISYWGGAFVIGFDVSSMFDTETRDEIEKDALVSYIAGVQYMVLTDLYLRAGFRYDDGERTANHKKSAMSLSAGTTIIIAQRLGLEVGYKQNIDAPEDLMVGFTIEVYSPFGN